MSLQVWLPLNREEIRNQGLADVTITNSGATYTSTEGKIGGSYYFNGSSRIQITLPAVMTTIKNTTVAAWVKSTSSTLALGGISHDSTPDYYAPGCTLYSSGWQTGTGSSWAYVSGGTVANTSVWHHVACTISSTDVTTYLDGVQVATKTLAAWGMTSFDLGSGHFIEIGSDFPGGNEYLTGYINDFRIYNNALSAKEVKKLSQGLILHYPLNRRCLGATNLLKNGFGELNNENWENSNIFTDVPANHSEIKKSYKNNTSIELIPLVRNCTYKFSSWIKAAQTTGNSYPSLFPYDADKLFIATYQCREGFNMSTMTTLKQQLNPGDTKIYVNDLSQWNANSGHYYDTAAIFSYTDGQGYTWPDGIYTRNCPAFANSTEAKTNLDKTNNIITLLSAYTGPTMPAGTKVCASTYGSTYFYPLGGISNTSIADWTYKEGTFSSQNVRLECAKYLKVYAYSTCYQAGMTLTNMTFENYKITQEYDTSGFGNHSIQHGTFNYANDTSKYNVSTYFNGSSYLQSNSNTNLSGDLDFTVSFWIKADAFTNDYASVVWNGYSGTNSAIAICVPSGRVSLDFWNNKYLTDSVVLATNNWHHVCCTKQAGAVSTSNSHIYIDGQEVTATANNYSTTAPNISGSYKWIIGRLNDTSSRYITGKVSDIRVYATALSAEDVLALYNNKNF